MYPNCYSMQEFFLSYYAYQLATELCLSIIKSVFGPVQLGQRFSGFPSLLTVKRKAVGCSPSHCRHSFYLPNLQVFSVYRFL